MPKIVIDNLFGKVLEVGESNRTLLQHFHDNRIDWLHECGGKGKCTTCKVFVVTGLTNFTPITASEQRFMDQKSLGSNERLSCQCSVHGDVVVKVPRQYKLPHIKYSDEGIL